MKSNEKPQMNNGVKEATKVWTCIQCGKKGEGSIYTKVIGKGVLCLECSDKATEAWLEERGTPPPDYKYWSMYE